jgi:RNA polymerase sigma factor (sigma-70 family)
VDFEELFQRLYPSLFRYLHRLTGDADLADDVAQESFVRLLSQSIPAEETRPWLFTVATNLVRDGVRKTGRRERLITTAPVLHATIAAPDAQLEQSERISGVRAALAQLPARDQQLLLMREEGFKYDEMAQAVGVAASSIGTLLARALRRFAEVYKAQEDRDDPRE